MYQTGLVLEQFVDAFDDIPFPQHDFVPHRHQLVAHVGLQPVDKVDTLIEEHHKKALAAISSVRKDLPVKECRGERFYCRCVKQCRLTFADVSTYIRG